MEQFEAIHLSIIKQKSNDYENELVSYVEYGRTDLMEKYLDILEKKGDGVPEVAPDADRAIKNIFVLSLGILSRTALRAGLDYATMDEMATFFLTRIEEKSGYAQVITFFRQMCMSFTNIVKMIKQTPSSSLTVHKIQQIVFSHMYEKITPALIADKMEMALPYLCRHFKSQTGKTITAYINEVKIEESKRLLSATNTSILDISVQLGFSSPNYMTTVFKKIEGTTPKEFRKSVKMPHL